MAQLIALEDFRRFTHDAGAIRHDVYACGDSQAPAVLVMHELPGLTQPTLNFAKRLSDRAFCVYLPHLFGEVLQERGRSNYKALCVSEEFAKLAAGVSAPVTTWLRALARRLSEEHQSHAIGVVGMCLTGGFVIPLILERCVKAPVAAQPAVPFSTAYVILPVKKGPWASQLNVADADVANAARRLSEDDLRLLAYRFKADRICVPEKVDRLRREFGDRLEAHEYDAPWWSVIKPPHAVLTYEFERAEGAGPEHPMRRAFETLVTFLDAHLRS